LKKIRPSFIPGILWLIISTILLTIPGQSLPSENWLSAIYFDKWVHIGMFAIMTTLWCWALTRNITDKIKLKRLFLYMGLLWLAYGIGMELVQKYFIPNRSFDLYDILADGTGSLVGLIFSRYRYIKN
jgi:VanZ family protein